MPLECEEFFIRQINEGLKLLAEESLTPDDTELLLVNPLDGSQRSDQRLEAEYLKPLFARCVTALNAAYDFDAQWDKTADKHGYREFSGTLLEWRKHNGVLYKESQSFLSGVVQNWYLKHGGRQKEREASGCFVATVCFDDPSHPTVSTIRHFRDAVLTENTLGRAFISWYYKVGPQVATRVAGTVRLKSLLRFSLSVFATILRLTLFMNAPGCHGRACRRRVCPPNPGPTRERGL